MSTHAPAPPSSAQTPATSHEGRIPPFLKKRLGYTTRTSFQYGDAIPIGWNGRTFLLTSPADIHHVLVTRASLYEKPPQISGESGQRRAGRGLLGRMGEAHRERRRLLQPMFRGNSVEDFAPIVMQETQRLTQRWRHGDVVDIAAEMSRLALSILISTLFGVDWKGDRESFTDAILARRQYTEFFYHSRRPFRDRFPWPIVRRNRWAAATIDSIIRTEIKLRQQGLHGNSILSKLLSLPSLSDNDIRDEVLTLTSAGHETIGDALAWCWYLIASHQNIEAEWYSDLHRAGQSTYTELIFQEAVRLYPPTWIFARVPVGDDVLPSGLKVGPQTRLLLCQYLMHRHPQYFPQPEQFDPLRFADSTHHAFRRGVYFPFGAGPHTCIGESFARMETSLVLPCIAKHFRFDLIRNQRIVPEPAVTLYPRRGIQVRIREQNNDITE